MTTTKYTDDFLSQMTAEDFSEELGTAIFQNALVEYIASAPKGEADSFEQFVSANGDSENFPNELAQKFPNFLKKLNEVMLEVEGDLQAMQKANSAE